MGWRATEFQFLIQCLQLSCSLVGEKAPGKVCSPGSCPTCPAGMLLENTAGGQGRLGAPQFHGWPGQAEFQWE